MAKLYLEAGHVIDAVLLEKVGLKVALYRKPLVSDPRIVCKLASATLAEQPVLHQALSRTGLLTKGQGKNDTGAFRGVRHPGVMLAMAYDLLLGRGLRGGGHLKRELVSLKSELQAALEAARQHRNSKAASQEAVPDGGSAFASLPRYIRVNRLRVPSVKGVKALKRDITERLRQRAQSEVSDVSVGELIAVKDDLLVPDLLVAHPRARPWLVGDSAVEAGDLVLQDRSSCLAALSAGLSPGTFVLDACAAPGSKTAHAVELLHGQGRVLACERNPTRAATLVTRLRQLVRLERTGRARFSEEVEAEASEAAVTKASGSSAGKRRTRKPASEVRKDSDDEAWFHSLDETSLQNAATLHFRSCSHKGPPGGLPVDIRVGDFLECDPTRPPFCNAEVILVDPSCSGSGLPEHHLVSEASTRISAQRLRRLSAFQRRILSHALRFPAARTVVYSTCSTNQEENEDVVEDVLSGSSSEASPPAFQVVEALPWWPTAETAADKQSKRPSWAKHCIRCEPTTHRCRGFFLCRLDRLPEGVAPAPAPRLQRRHQSREEVPCASKRRRLADPESSPAGTNPADNGATLPKKAAETGKRRRRRRLRAASAQSSPLLPLPSVKGRKGKKASRGGLRFMMRSDKKR